MKENTDNNPQLIIGASNGWLYAAGMFSLEKQENIFKNAGAEAVEFNYNWDKERFNALTAKKSDHYKYKALHLPKFTDEHTVEELIKQGKEIMQIQQTTTLVLHPTGLSESDYEKLASSNLPIAIENMDSAIDEGHDLEELKKLIEKYDFDFMLDVQHAYEHDHSMKYAEELFTTFKHKIKQLHISGETPTNIHELVHKADNREAIIDFTKKILSEKNIPIIIEGEYHSEEELKKEIEFLREELS
jgi:hypothetical protein